MVATPSNYKRPCHSHASQPRIYSYLATRLNLTHQMTKGCVSMYPELLELDIKTIIEPNLEVMNNIMAPNTVKAIVCRVPLLLGTPLPTWYDFLSTYGLSQTDIADMIKNHPRIVISGTIYHFGQVVLRLKEQGYTDKEIVHVLLPSHPEWFLV